MSKPKQHPLVSPPPSSGGKTKRPRRRSSLVVVWPPPKPDSNKSLDAQSYHANSLKDLGSPSTHSRSAELSTSLHQDMRRSFVSPAAQPGSKKLSPVPHSCPAGLPGAMQRNNDIMSSIPAPSCNETSPGQQQQEDLVSPAAVRAKLAMVSPGTVQEKLKTFSTASPGATSTTQTSPDSANSNAIRRTPPSLKKSPSKRLKNRWPPVTDKKESKRSSKGVKDLIRSDKVKSTLTRFESRRGSLSAIDSLPFGADSDDLNGSSSRPLRQMSKRHLMEDVNGGIISPDQVKARLTQFEERSRSMTDLGNSSYHGSLDGSSHHGRPRMIKKGSFAKRDAASSSTASSADPNRSSSQRGMNPIRESEPEIILPTGQKLPPPQRRSSKKFRRTNYCIRYEGPTLLSLIDVYGGDLLGNIPEADERFLKSPEATNDSSIAAPSRRISDSSPLIGTRVSRKRVSGSENDSLPSLPRRRSDLVDPDAPDMPKRTSNASWEEYDEFFEGGDEGSLEGSVEFLTRGGKRPDLWITPVKPRGSWMIKRVWDQEDADDKEQEHLVDGVDLMGSIRDLLGVPELAGNDELDFMEQQDEEEEEGSANKDDNNDEEDDPSKQFFMKMVYDIGGEVDESADECRFCKMGLAQEIKQILEETTYPEQDELDNDDDDAENYRMVYRIGEEGADDSDDEREYARMAMAPHTSNSQSANDEDNEESRNAAKMIYGRGEEDGDSDDEGQFKRFEQQAAAEPDAKMVYGNNGEEGYDSDDEGRFNKLEREAAGRRDAKMVYGNGAEDYDSDDERAFNKVVAQSNPSESPLEIESVPSNSRMVYGNGAEGDDSDVERSFRKLAVAAPSGDDEQPPASSKMTFGNEDGGDETDDEHDYNPMNGSANSEGHDMGSSSSDLEQHEDGLTNSARESATTSANLVGKDKEPRLRRRSSANDLKDIPRGWMSGVTGISADKQHFKEKSWVIEYGVGFPTEDTTEFSSTSTSEPEDTDKQPRKLPWEKKVNSPKKEKKEVKLW
eukprot:CAMPEP_0117041964 /NCGR_PEP_ID=MMETSP0472-20121206/29260_1 /TAXON_ID=693140 ORGANISM="Tiarina fusus, Strain LIS" /NCGR_SAMPLE_ID=MMETSP0472 /ASSEMBLY_ACC=CAM_ASM_000603 /LENGTH=1012 /DNA_ID=CAMNT_0004753091 /DNA_START=238 /DNA_END=3273 /DNA_ORIENTATION=+